MSEAAEEHGDLPATGETLFHTVRVQKPAVQRVTIVDSIVLCTEESVKWVDLTLCS